MLETPDQAWARELAQRIKKLQTSFADDDEPRRKALIRKEIREARGSMSKTEWKPKFELLKSHFSAWEEPRTEIRTVTLEKPIDLTPKQMVEKLVAAFPNLKERDGKQFARELRNAGFQSQDEEKPPEEPTPDRFRLPDRTAAMLDLREPPTLFPTPVFEVLLDGLMKALLELNESAIEVREYYKQFAPQSDGIASSHYGKMTRVAADDLKRVLRDYLTGDPATGDKQVCQVLDEVQKLLEGFIHAPGNVRKKLSEELKKYLAPEKIKSVVGNTPFKGKYWERYEELWKTRGYGSSDVLNSDFWGREYSRAFLGGFEDGGGHTDD